MRRARALSCPARGIDFGLVLLGLWLFIQLNPATLLFGAGDLRDFLAPRRGPRAAAEFFVSIEAFTAAANLVAVGAPALGIRRARPAGARACSSALVDRGAAVKTAAFAILMRAENVFAWLTPGAQLGLAAGSRSRSRRSRCRAPRASVLAAVLIMAATVLVNLAPPNPYLAATLKVWQQGHFLNFNGLTRLVSALWPFAALGYLILPRRRRGVR